MTDQETIANDLAELAALHGTQLTVLLSGVGSNISSNAANPTVVVQRPWIEPPDGYIPYDFRGAIDLPAVAGTAIVLAMQVPDGYDGVINGYSWNYTGPSFVEGSGELVVKLLRNGTPIRNFDNVTVEAGTPDTFRKLNPIRVYSKQVISMSITHVSEPLLVGQIVGSLVGYFYPSMG